MILSLNSPLLRTFSRFHPLQPFLCVRRKGISHISCRTSGCVCGVGSHTPYPYIHELLLHTDAVFQTYTLIESLEREAFDERNAVYLYIIDLDTELDGFPFLASYDGEYVMAVNADDVVTDLPIFKHFLFLYKDLSDDGQPLPVIRCISECGSVLSMDSIPLYEYFFQESDHTALEHTCS